ncbi:MAG TPA: type II toxin-antitoxin system VapC family toxin [Candidatus Sulfomarinibacteraceae bacterium]|nr:type II toxin-antitoxin system VapC family toxin [Candidatus Sulfomarinibacteraceae bacterium]
MIAYVDTSAFAKLLVPEPGTDAVDGLWEHVGDRYASLIGYAELRSAVAAAARSRRLGGLALPATRALIDALWTSVVAVEVDESLVREAGDLSDRHGLRAGDAIHLASALRVAEGPTAFIAFDGRLRDAAAAEGLIVLPDLA